MVAGAQGGRGTGGVGRLGQEPDAAGTGPAIGHRLQFPRRSYLPAQCGELGQVALGLVREQLMTVFRRHGQGAFPRAFGRVPLTDRHLVEHDQIKHDHATGHGARLQFARHDALQVGPDRAEDVQVVGGDGQTRDVPGLLVQEVRHGPLHRPGPAGTVPDHVAPGAAVYRRSPGEQTVQGREEFERVLPGGTVPGVLADGEQECHQPAEVLAVPGPSAVAQQPLDRRRDLTPRGVHVAVPVQRPVGGDQDRGRRSVGARCPGGPYEPARLARPCGMPGDVRRVPESPRPFDGVLAQLGVAFQPGDGRERAAAPGVRLGRRLQHARRRLVGVDGGRGQMRGTAFEVVPVDLRQNGVGGSAFVGSGRPHDTRPHERMPEGDVARDGIADQQTARHRLADVAHAVARSGGGHS
ncbi:hypothetical protein [Streptomyces sp. NPDC056160]|uniref:hypothetical protein n=1 Tax=Streptomyces sp. NPDC056160 TaxID=3345731 RepID=UPI0035D80E49